MGGASGGAAGTMPQPTILVVEDDPVFLRVVSVALQQKGYRVLPAHSGLEALAEAERLQAQGGWIDLLLTDIFMPGLNGRDLARQFLLSRPALRVLYMSAYTKDLVIITDDDDRDWVHNVLAKPICPDALCEVVRQTLALAHHPTDAWH